METTVEQLIKERSYASLTGEELVSVSELCETEEEFQTMKQFFQELDGVAASDKTIINPEVKQSLDAIFSAKFPGIHANWTAPETTAEPVAPVIPLHQRTWVRVAAIGLIVLGTAPFWGMLKTNDASKEKAVEMAKLETQQTSETKLQEQSGGSSSEPAFNQSSDAPQLAGLYEDETGAASGTYYETRDKAIAISAEPMTADVVTPAYAGSSYTWSAGSDTREIADGYYATGAETLTYSFSTEGRLADLNPNGYAVGEVNALSLAGQPDDILDLLSPAF